MQNVAPALNQDRRGRTLRLAILSAEVSLAAAFAAVGSTIPLFNIYRAEEGFTNAGISLTIVESGFDKPHRRRSKVLGIGAHELPTNRMLFVGDAHPAAVSPGMSGLQDELVEHHLAQRIGRTQPPCNHAHRPVAVAGKRSLHDGKANLDLPEAKRPYARLFRRRRNGGNSHAGILANRE